MIEHGITADNLLRTLPAVLRDGKEMQALATAIVDTLSARVTEIDALKIYTRIDELPEDLLDILAYDFKVDWYGYDYGITAKRAQIKNSINIHRRLGTAGAVEKALGDIYPGTEVQEWFDYGGAPYCFRVLLDVTNQRVTISHAEIVRAIDIFKSLRSHLQDNGVIYRSRTQIAVGVTCGYVMYGVRLCGTYPVRATQGVIHDENIVMVTDADGTAYAVPVSGEIKTGTYPAVATQGGIVNADIVMVTDADGVAFTMPVSGTYPARAVQGIITMDDISVATDADNAIYTVPRSGEGPEIATQGGAESGRIGIGADGVGVAYSVRFCGTSPGIIN